MSYTVDHLLLGVQAKFVDCACDLEIAHVCYGISGFPPVWRCKCGNMFLSFPSPPYLPLPPSSPPPSPPSHQEEEVVKDEVLGDPEYLEKLKTGFIEDMNLMLALSIHGPM